MQKYGTGQILNDQDEPVRKTAAAALTAEDVRRIENEDMQEE